MKLSGKQFLLSFFCSFMLAIPSLANAQDIQIQATPIENFLPTSPTKKKFGKLDFLGGLELTSDHEEFGGFSAISFVNANELVMVTDKARVVTTKIKRANEKPVGLEEAYISRVKASSGRTITGASDKDAEALEVAGSSFFIGYERNDRIMRFSMKDKTLIADNNYNVDLNPQAFPSNKGIEAIAIHPETGKLYAFAEQALNNNGNHQGFIISGGKVIRKLPVKYRDLFSLTDAAFLTNGDLILLERYYNPFTGVFMRMRRIKAATLELNNPLDGEVLIDVNYNYEIDNMEGIAITEMVDGSNRITLISDDNFSRNQRTILLEFRLGN